jgi:hypothetical protein
MKVSYEIHKVVRSTPASSCQKRENRFPRAGSPCRILGNPTTRPRRTGKREHLLDSFILADRFKRARIAQELYDGNKER